MAALGLVTYAALVGAAGWALLSIIPDEVSAKAFGRAVHLKAIHHRLISDAMVVAALCPFALWVECASVGWERSSLRALLLSPTASAKTDLAVFVLGQAHLLDVVGRFMMLGASLISGGLIHDYLKARFGFSIDSGALPLPLQILIYFFVITFFDYWTHRLDHSKWFWPLHRYHHSAEEFSVLTSARQHPVAFTSIFLINLPLAVLGASPVAMIYVNVIVAGLGFLIHSRMESDWGWAGRYLIQSPLHHRLHHKLDMSHPTGHFAMAPIWDHLFGTWTEKAEPGLAIGVDRSYRHGLWVAPDLLRDYFDFWRGVLAGRFRP